MIRIKQIEGTNGNSKHMLTLNSKYLDFEYFAFN